MSNKRSPGERIIELCKTYSISREDLAARSGLNIELIRRIEEDGLIPDLAPLVKISRVLGVRLGTLLDDHEEQGPVITRAADRSDAARFVTGAPADTKTGDIRQGLQFSALAADKGGRHMEPFIVDIDPKAEQVKSTHEGEEFIFVMEGKLKLEYGMNSHDLFAGDSIYYDSIVPHRLFTADENPVKILAVVYTPM
ncbi:MAG: cupin domain-containing protein [Treponema sp.]|jgi:transcriptional regulator with XRE-family HTH domain|nr:cupin domain-containing protein [Treponema sp.]